MRLVCVCLILSCILCCGFNYIDPESVLESVGVGDAGACLEWAFGPYFGTVLIDDVAYVWNKRHGDLFILREEEDNLYASLLLIGNAYLDYLNEQENIAYSYDATVVQPVCAKPEVALFDVSFSIQYNEVSLQEAANLETIAHKTFKNDSVKIDLERVGNKQEVKLTIDVENKTMKELAHIESRILSIFDDADSIEASTSDYGTITSDDDDDDDDFPYLIPGWQKR